MTDAYLKSITVIIIGYKSREKILDFIQKIPKNLKVIVVENSNDGELIKEISEKYDHINVYLKKNEGGSSALNFAVQKVKTQYFLQISPDISFNFNDLKKFVEEAKSGMSVVLNALPAEYFAKDHVPNSFNLFHKTIAKMSVKELQDWFGEVIKIHYPKLATYIKNKKLEIYEIPIVAYCAHEKCNASELAIKELMKKGFVNINEYSGGIVEYRKMIPVDR